MSSFKTFIEQKPLYYKEIDHERVHKAYALLKPYIKKPTVIHLVGTNGKGSTGRIMATLLHEKGTKVGHFSSPHILKFNERIWLEGKDSSDEVLEEGHERLYEILGQEICDGLSYFEYTTLLAFVVMEDMEVIVLEAGLGGEFDATNVVAKELSVITPIGLDHQDFLGDMIDKIATTKLNSIEDRVIIGFQNSIEVEGIALDIAKEKNAKITFLKDLVLREEILLLTQEMGWSLYLYENALLAVNALDILGLEYDIESLKKVKLFGRFYKLMPNVRIDVGHNLLAVEAIVEELKTQKEKIVLIYNSLDDKDYHEILKTFRPFIKRVEILPIETQRAIDINLLHKSLEELTISYTNFQSIKEKNNYLVFGSFYVVESFIKRTALDINNNLVIMSLS
ncbi:MAG TPA: bifunctional folylpolyglutamate synthase/dihydrofolate synthase [Sulfurovum sp.]|nr:bifunctional folylpolyglutamate synthase/dihydrofolate synthase [Sulfurovum sp.]